MQNFFLQIGAGDRESVIEGGIWTLLDKINPIQMPHDNFVTDLAVIMILRMIDLIKEKTHMKITYDRQLLSDLHKEAYGMGRRRVDNV